MNKSEYDSQEAEHSSPPPRKRVLIADDDEDTVEMLGIVLGGRGYECSIAHTGPQAITAARQHIPNAVIVDIGLPVADGFAVTEQLRSFPDLAEATIIGHSGHCGREVYERAASVGMDYLVLKPSDPALLIACIEPDEHPVMATSSVITDLRMHSAELLLNAAALSVRSRNAIARAREICRKHRSSI